MELAYIILIILAIIYIPIFIYVRFSPKAEGYGLVTYGPLVMIKTKYGIKLMDRLCVYTRFWRFFGVLSKAIVYILMAFMMFILIVDLFALPSMIGRGGLGIEYALAIPGLNPMLPLVYGVIGLVIALVTHELAHGMQARSNGMRVDSTGLLYGVVPWGAFVEPNEEDLKKSSRRAKGDVYAAGIATNFVVAVVLFAAMFGMLSAATCGNGDSAGIYSVQADTPAEESGIPAAAIILDVTFGGKTYDVDYYIIDGKGHFTSTDPTFSGFDPNETATVTYVTDKGDYSADVRLGLYINKVAADSPAAEAGLQSKWYMVSVNTTDGTSYPIYDIYTFNKALSSTVPGQQISISYVSDAGSGVQETGYFKLSANGNVGYLGVYTSVSGFSFVSPQYMLDHAKNPLYGVDTVTEGAYALISYIGQPFQGYSPVLESTHWWYDVPGGDVFWVVLSVVFWTFWLSLVLGITNALPAVPFDGGYVFAGGLDWLLERAGIKDTERRDRITGTVVNVVSMATIFILLLVIVVIIF
jgi:membrane-associated protease RseP (regulator of RpoE activity)